MTLANADLPVEPQSARLGSWTSSLGYGLSFALTRILASFAIVLTTSQTLASGPFTRLSLGWLGNFEHWDSGWLAGIAQSGYTSAQATAFYPGFPIMMRALSSLSGGKIGLLSAGVIIAWGSFALATVLLFKLVEEVFDRRAAIVSLVLLTGAPGSLFLVSAYSESTTLVLTVASSLLLQRKRFYLAAIFAGAAAAVSPIGAIFALAVFAFALRSRLGLIRSIVLGVISEAGALCYALYLWFRFGNPLENLSVETLWQRHAVLPFSALLRNITFLLTRRVNFAPLPLSPSNKNMLAVWVIDDFAGVVALGVLICLVVKLVRNRGLGGLPIDWVVFFVASLLAVSSSDITVIHNIPSTEAVARLTDSVFAMFPIAYIVTRRFGVLLVPIIGIGAALAVTAQALAILNYWIT